MQGNRKRAREPYWYFIVDSVAYSRECAVAHVLNYVRDCCTGDEARAQAKQHHRSPGSQAQLPCAACAAEENPERHPGGCFQSPATGRRGAQLCGVVSALQTGGVRKGATRIRKVPIPWSPQEVEVTYKQSTRKTPKARSPVRDPCDDYDFTSSGCRHHCSAATVTTASSECSNPGKGTWK